MTLDPEREVADLAQRLERKLTSPTADANVTVILSSDFS